MGKDQDIVQVDKGTVVDELRKNVIYQGLEEYRSIVEAKGHGNIFKMSEGHVKGTRPLVTLVNPDQKIGILQVELGEDHHPMQGINGRVYQRQGILIFNSYVVETLVINTWVKRIMFFVHKEEPSPYRRGEGADDACN